jgi:hypothetical protein
LSKVTNGFKDFWARFTRVGLNCLTSFYVRLGLWLNVVPEMIKLRFRTEASLKFAQKYFTKTKDAAGVQLSPLFIRPQNVYGDDVDFTRLDFTELEQK